MVKYSTLHDSCNEIQLSFKPLVIESDSLHKFMLIVLLSLNFVFHFMSYRSLNGYMIFPICLITYQFSFYFYFIELSLNISLSLNPSSLGSTLGITSFGVVAGDGEMKAHLLWVFDIFMYLILEGEQDQ